MPSTRTWREKWKNRVSKRRKWRIKKRSGKEKGKNETKVRSLRKSWEHYHCDTESETKVMNKE